MIKNTSNVYLYRLKFSQSGRCCASNRLILGLGANIAGAWGSPRDTLLRALDALRQQGLVPLCHSDFFRTKPVGGGRQPDYLNAVVLTQAKLAPATLLRLTKGLERKAGRRPGRRLSAAPTRYRHLGLWRPAPGLVRARARPRAAGSAPSGGAPARLCARAPGPGRAPVAPPGAGRQRAHPARPLGLEAPTSGRPKPLISCPPRAKSLTR